VRKWKRPPHSHRSALLTIVVRHQTIRLGAEVPLRVELEASTLDTLKQISNTVVLTVPGYVLSRAALLANQIGCPSIDQSGLGSQLEHAPT
jgi:hypothetical protein